MNILLVEDDPSLADYVSAGFNERGADITHASTGTEGLKLATQGGFDTLIIDRMLPELDGMKIVEQLRASADTAPILILSALSSVSERIEGLKVGADDYLGKPFDFDELYIRVEALIRRRNLDQPVTHLRVGELEIDLLKNEASRAGQKLVLQPREFRLLEYLMRHAEQVVTRTMLLQNVWDYHFDPQTNVIDVHISRLRQKIDKNFDFSMLKTVRGSGYMLHDPNKQ